LITAENPGLLADKIVRDGLSVRQAEALAQGSVNKPVTTKIRTEGDEEKDADTRALEKLLSDVTGMRVTVNHQNKGGDVRIHYTSLEQLDEICRRLQS
jgi:ParB family chromosome partitioning protein